MKPTNKYTQSVLLIITSLYASVALSANECRVKYKNAADNVITVNVNANQTKPINKNNIRWIQNKKNQAIKVYITNVFGGKKWVSLAQYNAIDPPAAPTFPYPNGIKLYNILCEATPAATIEIGTAGIITTLPTQPKIRSLTAAERSVAKSVFRNSINLSMVKVTNTVGLESRPWTTNTPPIYTINVGVKAYANLASNTWDGLLIHELAHVWQGQHGIAYMSNSAVHQTLARIQTGSSSGAYSYTAGKQWSKYNSEQQASIVARWFSRGKRSQNELYPYIRDNVRPGLPNAVTKFNTTFRRTIRN